VIALAIKLSSRGPMFFRQVRVGRGGSQFRLTKFRTMTAPEPAQAPAWATEHAWRITPVGRWLRRYRLDELPQLWNILVGDLSLVGPRPEQPEIVERLRRDVAFYDARHTVRPGLTGWAQINGGYAGSDDEVRTKLQYDLYYVKHQSLRLDLRIVRATARAVLSGCGG
jgi:lipopolysaccharide/colanic/teichoic acid biosynthesis glycosyltransferase